MKKFFVVRDSCLWVGGEREATFEGIIEVENFPEMQKFVEFLEKEVPRDIYVWAGKELWMRFVTMDAEEVFFDAWTVWGLIVRDPLTHEFYSVKLHSPETSEMTFNGRCEKCSVFITEISCCEEGEGENSCSDICKKAMNGERWNGEMRDLVIELLDRAEKGIRHLISLIPEDQKHVCVICGNKYFGYRASDALNNLPICPRCISSEGMRNNSWYWEGCGEEVYESERILEIVPEFTEEELKLFNEYLSQFGLKAKRFTEWSPTATEYIVYGIPKKFEVVVQKEKDVEKAIAEVKEKHGKVLFTRESRLENGYWEIKVFYPDMDGELLSNCYRVSMYSPDIQKVSKEEILKVVNNWLNRTKRR